MNTNTKVWIQTDSTQFVHKIDENKFELVEALNLNNVVYVINHDIVDLTMYEEQDILKDIESYGYDSIEEVKKIYGEENYKQILCECIFESMDETRYHSSTDVKEIIQVMKEDFNIELKECDFYL